MTIKWAGPIHRVRWYHRVRDWFRGNAMVKVDVPCPEPITQVISRALHLEDGAVIAKLSPGTKLTEPLLQEIYREYVKTMTTVSADRVEQLAKMFL